MKFDPELDVELEEDKRRRLQEEYDKLGFFDKRKVRKFEYRYPQYLFVSNSEEGRQRIYGIYKKVMKDLSWLLKEKNEGDLISSFKNLRAKSLEMGAEGVMDYDRMKYMIIREELKKRGRR